MIGRLPGCGLSSLLPLFCARKPVASEAATADSRNPRRVIDMNSPCGGNGEKDNTNKDLAIAIATAWSGYSVVLDKLEQPLAARGFQTHRNTTLLRFRFAWRRRRRGPHIAVVHHARTHHSAGTHGVHVLHHVFHVANHHGPHIYVGLPARLLRGVADLGHIGFQLVEGCFHLVHVGLHGIHVLFVHLHHLVVVLHVHLAGLFWRRRLRRCARRLRPRQGGQSQDHGKQKALAIHRLILSDSSPSICF